MNYDEFAFFNQQLAAMLREGIPLEGALKQLSAGMKAGRFRSEVEQLEADLAKGVPLPEALQRRNVPELYKKLVELGVRANDLPGMLTLLADYYHRANLLWTRLKGLMVYPLLVVLVSLGLTLVVSLIFSRFLGSFFEQYHPPPGVVAFLWMPPAVLACLGALGVAAVSIPRWRGWLRWRLPGFRDASLAQLACAMSLMLRKGTTLPDALALAEKLESNTPASTALARWRMAVAAGRGRPDQWSGSAYPFPPLFLWLVQKGGEDLAAGFQKAAEIFQGRASYRIEMALYGALPVSILFLGQMILWQLAPLIQSMSSMLNALTDMGGS
jgi:type IV pilus assembly protein PilC